MYAQKTPQSGPTRSAQPSVAAAPSTDASTATVKGKKRKHAEVTSPVKEKKVKSGKDKDVSGTCV